MSFPLLIVTLLGISGCDSDFLTEYPTDALSEATFWQTESDATMALVGCYELNVDNCHNDFSGWTAGIPYSSQMTELSRHKQPASTLWSIGINYDPTETRLSGRWSFNYTKISRCNYFLENIDNVEMDDTDKAEMIAEVKFIRAYCYFLLYQVYGGVPLVTTVLDFDEANSISRAERSEIVALVKSDLEDAIADLPTSRISTEDGRIEKGAALALLGRVLMGEEEWAEAATIYKTIMDLGRYEIDSRYKEIFEDEGDESEEVIWALRYMQDVYGESATHQCFLSTWYGGYSEMNIFQNVIDSYLMNDGLSIEESSLYDPENPFDNRDPRLYATVLLPNYTYFDGETYQGHPDSLATRGSAYSGHTGYQLKKFEDSEYLLAGSDKTEYGGDFKVFRYAEVLLSYLECEIESGVTITQSLLDATINQIRLRAAVNMPIITELDAEELRTIVRNERLYELGFEGIHYWDILRWKTADEVVNADFYGMKLTDDPENYTGTYTISDQGYLYSCSKAWDFEAHNYLWPIPQTELDINGNLEQNTGY
jgi:hypothetical protein